MREAPAITIIEELLSMGATIRAHDPEALKEARKVFGDRIEYSSSQYDILAGADALMVITDWNEYRNPDFERMRASLRSPLIIDGRNLYRPDRQVSAMSPWGATAADSSAEESKACAYWSPAAPASSAPISASGCCRKGMTSSAWTTSTPAARTTSST
jgi:hypothetical protein